LAHQFAIASERITADSIEVGEFPDMIQKYRVNGVPKIVVNETIEFVGAQPVEVFLKAVLQAGS